MPVVYGQLSGEVVRLGGRRVCWKAQGIDMLVC